MSLNTHYMVLFKSPRDAGQIAVLGRQLYPEHNKIPVDAFKDATSTPHYYLLMDVRPETGEHYRVRANIFPGEQQIVYKPK